jgi:hypothetical protein
MRQLPKLQDLYEGNLELKDAQNELNVLLNQPPKSEWIKEHPFARGVKYIPIERIEYLLTRLFRKWRVDVRNIQTIANSVVVTVRLHYQNIEDEKWSYQDGIGAAPIQTEQGQGAMNWDKVRADSVMKAAPAAESYAIKDAADKIGKIFGKDLNRKDEIMYDSLIPDKPTVMQIARADSLIQTCTGDEDYKEIMEAKLRDKELTVDEYRNIIHELEMNQPKVY